MIMVTEGTWKAVTDALYATLRHQSKRRDQPLPDEVQRALFAAYCALQLEPSRRRTLREQEAAGAEVEPGLFPGGVTP